MLCSSFPLHPLFTARARAGSGMLHAGAQCFATVQSLLATPLFSQAGTKTCPATKPPNPFLRPSAVLVSAVLASAAELTAKHIRSDGWVHHS